MRKSLLGSACLSLVLLLGVPSAAQQGLGPVVEVGSVDVDPIMASVADGPGSRFSGMVRCTYQNTGSRAVTAWDHRCLVATNDGRVGWSGTAEDAFPVVQRPDKPGGTEPREAGFVDPGETFVVEFGRDWKRDGPFAIQTCGLVAVVLEGGEAIGDPAILDDLFNRRRAIAEDIRRLANQLDGILERSVDVTTTTELHAALADVPVSSFFKPDIDAVLRESSGGGQLPRQRIQDLRDRVRRSFNEALTHLRPVDRGRLEGE